MASPEIAQSYEDPIYRPSVDVKVPTTLEVPVDDWQQEVTDILSPDLIISEIDPSARRLGYENGAVVETISSTPVVAPSTKIATDLPSTKEASLTNAADDGLPSTTKVSVNNAPNDSLPSTTEASVNNAPDDSLPSTAEDSLLLTPKTGLPPPPGIGFPKTQAALGPADDSTLCENLVEKLALRILDIIQRYGHSTGAGSGVDWAGKNKFLPLVERTIEQNEAVKMVLPAFPCVSVFTYCPF